MRRMKKPDAIKLLGGTIRSAAQAVGITPQGVSQWPDELPQSIVDRVQAALARAHAPEVLTMPIAAMQPTDGAPAAPETEARAA